MISPNVKWQKYLNSSNPSINKYFKNYGDSILQQTFHRLTYAIKAKKSHIILFRFKESDIVSKIYQKDYMSALEALLNLCVHLEKYEMCSEIHSNIKLLKLKKARGKPKAKVIAINL